MHVSESPDFCVEVSDIFQVIQNSFVSYKSNLAFINLHCLIFSQLIFQLNLPQSDV